MSKRVTITVDAELVAWARDVGTFDHLTYVGKDITLRDIKLLVVPATATGPGLMAATQAPPDRRLSLFKVTLRAGVIATPGEIFMATQLCESTVAMLDGLSGDAPIEYDDLGLYSLLFNARWSPTTPGARAEGVRCRCLLAQALARFNDRLRLAAVARVIDDVRIEAALIRREATDHYTEVTHGRR